MISRICRWLLPIMICLYLAVPARAMTWIETPYDRWMLLQTVTYKCHYDVMANFDCSEIEVATIILAQIRKDFAQYKYVVCWATDFGDQYIHGYAFSLKHAKESVSKLLLGKRVL